MTLPAPTGTISVKGITLVPPSGRTPVLSQVDFELAQGESLGIIGPSGSGKSCLARALLGIWPVQQGRVRLDGADISTWDRQNLGPYIGYLPQDIELFNGSISENICRFSKIDPDKIIEAARKAGVHDLILQLPNGYDTDIKGSSGLISGGHRQRIGLARALYGNPKFLVLDEPNSNLDDKGERELVNAIRQMREEKATLAVITHRTNLLKSVDKILVMSNGRMKFYGARDEVLAALAQAARPQEKWPVLNTGPVSTSG
jgi:ATP-binding cassette subfamily C protein EexD